MYHGIIPENYAPVLDTRQTQRAIKALKDCFERELSYALNLTRVSAPIFVRSDSGLNDNLNGVERPVAFDLGEDGAHMEIVHSLAKWKREALGRYGFRTGEGLYTDMNAIRRDEQTDNLHSIYVDQWDWERVIAREDRTRKKLHNTVRAIYAAILRTEALIGSQYPALTPCLPPEISFITAQELEDRYPDLPPKAREEKITRALGAVFLEGIGGKLASGVRHDGRAPDYDDWTLNGDILVYHAPLDCALELSSMGVRVDEQALRIQLAEAGCEERARLPFHKKLLEGALPYTIGGGIGQSRLCMFYLRKAHIGEVQCSVWPREVSDAWRAAGIPLL